MTVRSVLALWLVLGLALGCGPSRDAGFVRALAVGDRAKTAGRHLEAAEAYERAARGTQRAIDRDYALFLAASSYVQGEDRADAARLFDELASTKGSYAARGRYERALLTLETDEAAGVAALEAFVLAHPDSALARRALAVVLDRTTKTPAERIHKLDQLLVRVRKTDLEERVRYEIALAHEAAGDGPRAVMHLVALAHDFPYPHGNLRDDALYRAAEIEDRLGRPRNAIEHLEALLADRETTDLVGSYERPKYLPAAMRIATLYRDRLGDPARARDAYLRIFDDFRHSTARDDALFEAMLLSRKLGDEPATCSYVAKLTRTFPESRYVACAPKLCASAKPAREGDRCADYIARKIDAAR